MPQKEVLTTLTGTAAPILLGNVKDPQELTYLSPWLPRYWTKTVPFVVDHVRLDPCSQAGLNKDNVFEIAKIGHAISDFVIKADFPPGQVTGGNPNPQANYSDFLGYTYWSKLEMKFLANEVFDVEPHDLYFEHRKNHEVERRDAINELILGDRSTAIRTAAFVNGVTTYTDFFLPFTKADRKCLPIGVLSQKLRFVLKTRPLREFTRIQVPTLTTQVASLTGDLQLQILMEVVHLSANEAGLFLAMSQDKSGIAYMIHQHIRQYTETIGTFSSNVEVPVRLNGITKPIRILHWALIPDAMVNNSNRNDEFFFRPNPPLPIPFGLTPYNPHTQWRIEANGQIVQRSLWRDQNRVHMHQKFCISPHGDEVFTCYFGRHPNAIDCSDGYADWTNFNNPLLYITLGVGGTGADVDNPNLPQRLRVYVNAEDYNFWYLKKGNFTKSFH